MQFPVDPVQAGPVLPDEIDTAPGDVRLGLIGTRKEGGTQTPSRERERPFEGLMDGRSEPPPRHDLEKGESEDLDIEQDRMVP